MKTVHMLSVLTVVACGSLLLAGCGVEASGHAQARPSVVASGAPPSGVGTPSAAASGTAGVTVPLAGAKVSTKLVTSLNTELSQLNHMLSQIP